MIDYKIERKKFELVGDLIGAIITAEFENQVLQFYNTDCEGVDIYRDRNVPIDATELAVINVSYGATEFSNKHQGSKTGDNSFFIDVYCQSRSKKDERGDKLANLRLQRLLGIIDDILENPIYKNLGQAPPHVGGTLVENIEVVNTRKEDADALASTFGRVTFRVKVNETTGLLAGNEILTAITQIKLGISDKGYKYEYGISGPNPPVDTRFSYIVNQFDEVIEILPGGSRYSVTELQEILDDITGNESTITENLPD